MVRLIRALWVLATLTMVLMLGTTSVLADGNNGTLKVHEAGTPSGTESNDPKICEFNFEGFGFDVGQVGYIVVDGQGQTDAPAALTLPFGPADASGFYATAYINSAGGTLTLADGHYKATLYGKDTGTDAPDLADEKAKSKVFKVECVPAPTPTPTPVVTPTPTPTVEVVPTPTLAPPAISVVPNTATDLDSQERSIAIPFLIAVAVGVLFFYLWMRVGAARRR